jgi:roadblock/LC7 domain-containing protein
MRFNTELENDKFGPGKFRVPEFETKWKTCMANKLNTVDGVLIDYTDDLDKQTKRIIGLKCMADQTMGAGNLLRFMHEEAQTENDLQTYNETVGLVKEGGHVTQILQQGQLVHYDEHMKLLSIHGGLSVGSWLYLPGKKKQANSFKGWVSKLNKWGKKQVEAGLEGKYEESKDIVELQEPKVVNGSWQGTNPHSIIHGRPWNEEFNIASLSSNEAWDLKAQGHSEEVILQRLAERGIVDLAAEMKNSDVDMVACGHSPIGKRAMFIREWNGVLTIFGDTSAWNPASGSTIKTEKGRVQIFSTDKDESGNEILIVADSNDPEVGVQLPDGSWVVGKVVSTGERVCTKWTPAKANNGSNAGYGTPGKDTYLKAGETPSAVETFKIE